MRFDSATRLFFIDSAIELQEIDHCGVGRQAFSKFVGSQFGLRSQSTEIGVRAAKLRFQFFLFPGQFDQVFAVRRAAAGRKE